MTTKRFWTVDEDDRLLDGRAAGRTVPEIAADLGRTGRAPEARLAWLREHDQTSTASKLAAPVQGSPEEPPVRTSSEQRARWTPEDDYRLADMRRRGLGTAEMATALGRTYAAVAGRAGKLMAAGVDIPSRRTTSQWTPERLAAARDMRDQGMTYHQIAVRVGSEASAVRRALMAPEDSPGESVHDGRWVDPVKKSDAAGMRVSLDLPRLSPALPDLDRAAREIEQAQAALDRARERYNEAVEPLVVAVRDAIRKAGLVVDPTDECGGTVGGPERELIDHLRRQGLVLRRAA